MKIEKFGDPSINEFCIDFEDAELGVIQAAYKRIKADTAKPKTPEQLSLETTWSWLSPNQAEGVNCMYAALPAIESTAALLRNYAADTTDHILKIGGKNGNTDPAVVARRDLGILAGQMNDRITDVLVERVTVDTDALAEQCVRHYFLSSPNVS